MPMSERHQRFADLHQAGCFVIPNPWDIGSARMMAALGAKALATSSAAHAFTLGRADMAVGRDEALAHAQAIVAATDLPVSGDFENGFADAPETVAETVRFAAEVGLSGCSIEDTIPADGSAVERPAWELVHNRPPRDDSAEETVRQLPLYRQVEELSIPVDRWR